MELAKVSEDEARAVRASRRGKWKKIVSEFVDSDMDVAEIKDFDCTAKGAYQGIRYVIRAHGYPVVTKISNGRIFIVRTDL